MQALNVSVRRLMVVPLAGLLTGCPRPNGTATIRFEQLGACNGYKEGNAAVTAGPNAAFVLFKVTQIDNRSGTSGFSYDPSKLYLTSSSPRAFVSPSLTLAQKIGVLGTTATTVAAGTNLQHNGYAVVAAPTSSSPDPQQEANSVNYFLSYESGSSDPGVLLDKKNASQTQYQGAQNCLGKAW